MNYAALQGLMVRIDAAVYFCEEDRHRSLFRLLNIDSKVDQELTYPRSVGDSWAIPSSRSPLHLAMCCGRRQWTNSEIQAPQSYTFLLQRFSVVRPPLFSTEFFRRFAIVNFFPSAI